MNISAGLFIMAMDEWPFWWPVQIQDTPSVNYSRRVAKTQFGNGYEQVSEDGPNAETKTFQITFSGQINDVHTNPQDVAKFLRQHVVRPFVYTPPDGEKGLYRVVSDSVVVRPYSRLVQTVTATITTALGWQQ